MGKEILCGSCGEKTGLLTRMPLSDGQYICKNCSKIIPKEIRSFAKGVWGLDEYNEFVEYINYSGQVLLNKFTETHRYKNIYLDGFNGLFYISNSAFSKLNENTLIYSMEYLYDYDLDFIPDEFHDGIISTYVKGRTYFSYYMHLPYYAGMITLEKNAKAKGKVSGFFHKEIAWEKPRKMEEFLRAFDSSYERIMDEMEEEEKTSKNQFGESEHDVLSQAMSLFMLDSLDGVTQEFLKGQRNRLIKAFHPDNEAIDEVFSQKINNAYDLLLSAIG